MLQCHVDHLVVTAPSLQAGAEYVEQTLGVTLQPGGEHPRMGTHNQLLRLGEASYLEVIAPNPEALRPQRPRWFGLDELGPGSTPRLATWVARTTSLRQVLALAGESLGTVESMSRGALNWLISVPADGRLLLGGVVPAFIEWQVPVHPAAGLPDTGCALLDLELFHPQPQRVAALLARTGLGRPLQVTATAAFDTPYLRARIDTPRGVRTIGGARNF